MSYLIRNKKTGVECWVEQETLDQITDLKMWGTFERINPTNAKEKGVKVTTPTEVIEFIKQKQEAKTDPQTNKPKYKSKPKK